MDVIDDVVGEVCNCKAEHSQHHCRDNNYFPMLGRYFFEVYNDAVEIVSFLNMSFPKMDMLIF